jgi:monoamine oxidase
MAQHDVIVIGGGAAGLAAARELSAAGRAVLLLEARPRLGGRIHTLHEAGVAMPIELGAEFVHGRAEEVFRLVPGTSVLIDQLPDAHWWSDRRKLVRRDDFWPRIGKILGRAAKRDEPLAEFLRRARIAPRDRKLVARFVEGYHAADLEKVGTRSLDAGEGDNAQFRIVTGYDSLLNTIHAGFAPETVEIRMSTAVTRIAWRRGEVEVIARTLLGNELSCRARAAVVTLPLGVLRSDAIAWDRRPRGLSAVLEKLEMGNVCKIVFLFRERFWDDDLNFIHASGPDFPTWWTYAPAAVPLMTAWTGGPPAAQLLDLDERQRVDRALASLSKMLGVPRARVDDLLEAWWTHDWRNDPFSRGAYGYELAGATGARKKLAAPVEQTIFFAGEACEPEQSGTVAGAIASGRQAAERIIAIPTAARARS